jgi:DNA-binding transcriptional ArsR family regulator
MATRAASLSPAGPVEAAEVFKALGHPARVTIARALARDEKCVSELVAAVGLGWSTVSRHLTVLREAGVLADDKRGVKVFYRLKLPCVARFIACLDNPADHPDLMQPACGCD